MKPLGKTFLTLFSAIFLFSTLSLAQEDDYVTSPDDGKDSGKKKGGFDKEKLYIGGGLGLQFGTNTIIDISPLIGYRFNDELSAGLGLTYIYSSVRYLGKTYSTNVYGGGPFLRYVFVENLFLHVEYQILNAEYYQWGDTFRQDVHYFWVGGGFRQELGGNSYLMIMGLYDINYNSDLSIYPMNPILRGGVVFGL